MAAPIHLVVAIDETGEFTEQKLLNEGPPASGMVAVLSHWTETQIASHLEQVGSQHGLTFTDHFHAGEILLPAGRYRLGLNLTQEAATAAVDAIRGATAAAIDAIAGVHGILPGRRFFNEQQAWGETLLALLHHVGTVEHDRLAAAATVTVVVASRKHLELTGFGDPEVYHRDLATYLQQHVLPGRWPKVTSVEVRVATKDPFLIMADFHAALTTRTPEWSMDLADLYLPASWDASVAVLRQVDVSSAVFLQMCRGEPVPAQNLTQLPEQQRFEALRRLTTMAHGLVSDRFGQGGLSLALRVANLVWQASETLPPGSLQAELCTIAAEVFSHQGLPESSFQAATWRERSEALPTSAWANGVVAAKAARLNHRCQTVQLDSFNVFAFEDAYCEFGDHLREYEALAGGADRLEGEVDELYGKLLGTLGQAAGFLAAQFPDTGEEAAGLFRRSQPHFGRSQPVFGAQTIGFQLTDLWDRGQLAEATDLLAASGLPPAEGADPYTLLHRLRLTAARSCQQLPSEPVEPLVARLLALLANPETHGATPFDLCVKWALYMRPQDGALRRAGRVWLAGLNPRQVALVATSLPLHLQLHRPRPARGALEELLNWPGFAAHWRTDRAKPLRDCVANREPPSYLALRGMPWNYA
jgi:hypothetical protein